MLLQLQMQAVLCLQTCYKKPIPLQLILCHLLYHLVPVVTYRRQIPARLRSFKVCQSTYNGECKCCSAFSCPLQPPSGKLLLILSSTYEIFSCKKLYTWRGLRQFTLFISPMYTFICFHYFREVMKLCSPLQRIKLVTQLGALLRLCSAMLGSLCVSECLCELLNTMLDTTPIVRDTTHNVWRSVQSSIKSNGYATNEYSKILDALGRKYFSLVGTLSSSIKLCQEVRIKDQLGAVLGIGCGIHDHIVNIVRLHASGGVINTSNSTSSNSSSKRNNSIIKCISNLYMPDPAVCGVRVTASVLETRNYTYNTNEGNYLISYSS